MNEKLFITKQSAGKSAQRFSRQLIGNPRWRKTRGAFGLLLLAVFLMGSSPPAPHPQVAAKEQRIFLTSGPGDDISICPRHEKKCHIPAVLTYGHDGCLAIDAKGFCTAGAWPTIPGAHWIWSSQLTTPLEATNGSRPITFIREIFLPNEPAAAAITITADNAYEVSLFNGRGQWVIVGSDGNITDPYSTDTSFQSVETWDLTAGLEPGYNFLYIKVSNYSGCGSPICNPAGLIYSIEIQLFS